MTMVKICPTCKKFVPTSATACPICGNKKLVVANAPDTPQNTPKIIPPIQSTTNTQAQKKKRKSPVLFIFTVLLLIGAIAVAVKYVPIWTNPIQAAIEPHVKAKIAELKKQYGLKDLSYQIVISEKKNELYATGEIIFVSNDIENLAPKEQYNLMQKIGTDFFGDLGTTLNFDGYWLSVGHGEGYSVWRTRKGDRYVAGYYNLVKNGR